MPRHRLVCATRRVPRPSCPAQPSACASMQSSAVEKSGVSPQGKIAERMGSICHSLRAAYSHSASVGRRPPSHAQKASAVHQSTQLIGCRSRAPDVLDQLQPAVVPGIASVTPSNETCTGTPSVM